jgi:hypothetical protein
MNVTNYRWLNERMMKRMRSQMILNHAETMDEAVLHSMRVSASELGLIEGKVFQGMRLYLTHVRGSEK